MHEEHLDFSQMLASLLRDKSFEKRYKIPFPDPIYLGRTEICDPEYAVSVLKLIADYKIINILCWRT